MIWASSSEPTCQTRSGAGPGAFREQEFKERRRAAAAARVPKNGKDGLFTDIVST
jgi:hypothetical protein